MQNSLLANLACLEWRPGLASGGLCNFDSPDPPPTAPPPPAAPARPSFEEAAGETREQAEAARVQGEQILDILQANGITNEERAQVEQMLLEQRGADLRLAINRLQGLADQVVEGLIQPEELRAMADNFNEQIQAQVASGAELHFPTVMNSVSQNFPDIQARVADYHVQAQRVQQEAGQLGNFDQADFERRYQPALNRLIQDYDERTSSFEDQMNSRGLMPQGSFDATGATGEPGVRSGSEPWEHGRAVLGREFAREAGNVAQEAQAASEAQRLGEFQVGSGARLDSAAGDIQAAATPLRSTIEQGQSMLELSAGRNQNIGAAGQNLGMTQAEQENRRDWAVPAFDAASQYYNDMLAQQRGAEARRAATSGTALTYRGAPQQARLATNAGVSANVYGSDMGYAAALAAQQGANYRQAQERNANLWGAGIGAAGALGGAMIGSSEEFKEAIENMSDEDYSQAVDDIFHMDVKKWKYKDGIADSGKHIGIIAEEAPEDIVTGDGKYLDVTSYLGKLTMAVKQLAKEVRSPLGYLIEEGT